MISTAAAPSWEGSQPASVTRWLLRACLTLAAFGVAADVTIATFLGSGGNASLASSVVLGAPIAVGAGWHLVTEGRIRRMAGPLLVLVAFVAWNAASVFWAAHQDDFLKDITTRAQLLVFVWLSWQLVRSEGDLRAMLAGYLAGCVGLVALTWRNRFAGVFATWERYAADGFDPNDMAVYLALGIPMAAYLALAGERIRKGFLWYFPVAFTGLALSGSRGGLLSALVAVGGVVVWISRRTLWGWVVTLALLSAGIAFAGWAVPSDTWSRLFTVQEQLADGGVGDRTEIWRAGLRLLPSHPLVGVGAGGFENAVVPALNGRLPAHNTPLSIAVELGAIGLLLFFGAVAAGLRGVRRSGLDQKALAWCLALTWFVGSTSLTWGFRKTTWFVFLVIAVLGAVPRPKQPGGENA